MKHTGYCSFAHWQSQRLRGIVRRILVLTVRFALRHVSHSACLARYDCAFRSASKPHACDVALDKKSPNGPKTCKRIIEAGRLSETRGKYRTNQREVGIPFICAHHNFLKKRARESSRFELLREEMFCYGGKLCRYYFEKWPRNNQEKRHTR